MSDSNPSCVNLDGRGRQKAAPQPVLKVFETDEHWIRRREDAVRAAVAVPMPLALRRLDQHKPCGRLPPRDVKHNRISREPGQIRQRGCVERDRRWTVEQRVRIGEVA